MARYKFSFYVDAEFDEASGFEFMREALKQFVDNVAAASQKDVKITSPCMVRDDGHFANLANSITGKGGKPSIRADGYSVYTYQDGVLKSVEEKRMF